MKSHGQQRTCCVFAWPIYICRIGNVLSIGKRLTILKLTNPEKRNDIVDEFWPLMEIFNSGMLKGENTTYDPTGVVKHSWMITTTFGGGGSIGCLH